MWPPLHYLFSEDWKTHRAGWTKLGSRLDSLPRHSTMVLMVLSCVLTGHEGATVRQAEPPYTLSWGHTSVPQCRDPVFQQPPEGLVLSCSPLNCGFRQSSLMSLCGALSPVCQSCLSGIWRGAPGPIVTLLHLPVHVCTHAHRSWCAHMCAHACGRPHTHK